MENELLRMKNRSQLSMQKFNAPKVEAFCKALKARISDPASGLGKAYLRLLVDEIRLKANELRIRGSYRRVADALGMLKKTGLGEVPSPIPEWRARQDLNPRPPGS